MLVAKPRIQLPMSRWRSCMNPVGTEMHKRYAQTAALSNPTKLFRHDATVHLLGTMHIAEASAVAARDLIRREYARGTLGGVFLELDTIRFERLKQKSTEQADESLLSLAMSILSRPSRSPLASLVELALTGMYRTLHRLGFASGVEFKAAIETAERFDIPIILGDQHIQATLARLADGFRHDFDLQRLMSMAFTQASEESRPETPIERSIREAFQAIAQGDVELGQERLAKLIDQDTIREIIRPMQKLAPNVTTAILHERDLVMTDNLIAATDRLPPEKNNLVAIVGLAHVEGIAREWQKRNAIIRPASSDHA